MKNRVKFALVPAVVIFGLTSCGGNAAPSDTTLLTKNGALRPNGSPTTVAKSPTSTMRATPGTVKATTTTSTVPKSSTTTMPKIGK